MSNPKDQKPLPSQGASAPSVPGASAEPTRAATGDVRGLPKEIEDCLYEFTNDLMSAMHDLAGPGAMRQADASKADLRSAISGELARQRDMTKDALDALARVEKERDEARLLALAGLDATDDPALARKRAGWREETGRRLAAAAAESARLREALAAERWLVAWQRTMRTLHESLTDRARSRVIRGWWHKANRRARAAEKRVARARAALSSSPATPENSATKEE